MILPLSSKMSSYYKLEFTGPFVGSQIWVVTSIEEVQRILEEESTDDPDLVLRYSKLLLTVYQAGAEHQQMDLHPYASILAEGQSYQFQLGDGDVWELDPAPEETDEDEGRFADIELEFDDSLYTIIPSLEEPLLKSDGTVLLKSGQALEYGHNEFD